MRTWILVAGLALAGSSVARADDSMLTSDGASAMAQANIAKANKAALAHERMSSDRGTRSDPHSAHLGQAGRSNPAHSSRDSSRMRR